MKALSLREPFATLIVNGKKTIELRTWNTKFRGEFLVHASKIPIIEQCEKFGFDVSTITLGAIIGKATLYDVKEYESREEWEKDQNLHLADASFFGSDYGFLLKDAVKFNQPIPCNGSLNFWNVPDSVLAKVEAVQ